ncbi:hypothetical protein OH779_38935 [Actinacidiphila glaucinigra]|uniref:hypothetical protein n=1 Tax=Actinacidiphila glaucinigra TaxID=235986 RepID=UPI00386DBDE9
MSSTDTDMMSGWDIPKNDPADVVRQALDGLEAGALEGRAPDSGSRGHLAPPHPDVFALSCGATFFKLIVHPFDPLGSPMGWRPRFAVNP